MALHRRFWPLEQLLTRDLRPGDLMLQVNSGTVASRLIEWAQRLAHQLDSQVVHGAVMFDNNFMVEALGHGIQASDLRVQHAAYGYLVYRPRREDLAKRAAKCAKAMFEINQSHKNLSYPLPHKMAGSLSANSGAAPGADEMVKLFNRIREGAEQPFFCSQFVVFVYERRPGIAVDARVAAADEFVFRRGRLRDGGRAPQEAQRVSTGGAAASRACRGVEPVRADGEFGAGRSQLRARLPFKFPAIREISREFASFAGMPFRADPCRRAHVIGISRHGRSGWTRY